MKAIRNLGVSVGLFPGRRDVRVPADKLDVTYPADTEQKSVRVKEISLTGLYILTDDRWALGTSIPLTLKAWSLQEKFPPPSLRLRARVVRHGKDGVGLTFLYGDIDTAAWLRLLHELTPQSARRDLIHTLRAARALAFLCRICPSHEAESLTSIRTELAYESGERALEILVTAQDLVERRGFEVRTDVSPSVINQILDNGSRTSAAWLRRYWSGLLAATAMTGADDEHTLSYAALLAQLDPVRLRILTASCTRAGCKWDDTGEILPRYLACNAEEIKRIAQVNDLTQIERDLDCLFRLGLLEQTIKLDPFSPIDQANLTPTRVGLALYAECNGWPEKARASHLPEQMTFVSDTSASDADAAHSRHTSMALHPAR